MGAFRISRCLLYTLVFVSLLMVGLNIYAVIPPAFDGTNFVDYVFLFGMLFYLGLIVFVIVQKVKVDPSDLKVKQEEKEMVAVDGTSSEEGSSDEEDHQVFRMNQTPFPSDQKQNPAHSFQ